MVVSAKGSTAFVPSDDTTSNFVPSLLTERLVVTFVTLAVFAVTAELLATSVSKSLIVEAI